jgi:hypothetical protein
MGHNVPSDLSTTQRNPRSSTFRVTRLMTKHCEGSLFRLLVARRNFVREENLTLNRISPTGTLPLTTYLACREEYR